MHIDAGILTVAISAISTLVVAVSVFVAARQLRSMRRANEIQTLTALEREWASLEMDRARTFIRSELPSALEDQLFVADLRSNPTSPRVQDLTRVANFFERVGMYVASGILSERLAVMAFGISAMDLWPIMRPAVAIVRAQLDVPVLYHFEDLAMRAPLVLSWIAKRGITRLRRDRAMDALIVHANRDAAVGDGEEAIRVPPPDPTSAATSR